jgi:hypothetical protein
MVPDTRTWKPREQKRWKLKQRNELEAPHDSKQKPPWRGAAFSDFFNYAAGTDTKGFLSCTILTATRLIGIFQSSIAN